MWKVWNDQMKIYVTWNKNSHDSWQQLTCCTTSCRSAGFPNPLQSHLQAGQVKLCLHNVLHVYPWVDLNEFLQSQNTFVCSLLHLKQIQSALEGEAATEWYHC